MTALSFRAVDLADKQTAFTGLLSSPVAAPWIDQDHYALVTRHERDLQMWCNRLGYRLTRIDRCVRLRRPALDGFVAHPRGEAPRRRPLVLALLAAAGLEDQREDSITLQELSDTVRRSAALHGLSEYDPAQRAPRADLVSAVRLLATHGVLEQRTRRSDLLESWEREGAGIGAGYVIHRDALVLLVDTRDAELAFSDTTGDTDTRRARLLRTLVETQALRPFELTDEEQTYLTRQRHQLVAQAEEMTGGMVEIRSDSLVLVLPTDRGLPNDLFVSFPDTTAADWVALSVLAGAIAVARPDDTPGHRRCVSSDVSTIAESVHRHHGPRLTVVLRESPEAVRAAAQQKLVRAGLLDVAPNGDWILPPEAGRYRDADLTVITPADATDRSSVLLLDLFQEAP